MPDKIYKNKKEFDKANKAYQDSLNLFNTQNKFNADFINNFKVSKKPSNIPVNIWDEIVKAAKSIPAPNNKTVQTIKNALTQPNGDTFYENRPDEGYPRSKFYVNQAKEGKVKLREGNFTPNNIANQYSIGDIIFNNDTKNATHKRNISTNNNIETIQDYTIDSIRVGLPFNKHNETFYNYGFKHQNIIDKNIKPVSILKFNQDVNTNETRNPMIDGGNPKSNSYSDKNVVNIDLPIYKKPTDKPIYQPNVTNSVLPIVKPKPNLVKTKPKLVLEPIKPLGIKPMETSVEAKLAGNVTVPAMSNTKGVTQNYTGSKALQIQGKPSGYINQGDNTGRQEFRKGGWLDGIDNNNPIQDNTRVKTTVIPNQDLISKSNLNKNKGTLKSIDRMPVQPLTREEVRKGIKFTTDVAGLFYPPAAIAGAAMDMHRGDKTGALIGLIPGAKDFLTNKNMVTKLATKAFNLGIPNKVIQPSKKVIREAGKYIKGSAEVVDAKDDIGTPIVETVKSNLRNGGWLDGLDNNKFQEGGEFGDYKQAGPVEDSQSEYVGRAGMTGMMRSKIATEANYGNPSALRMVSPNPNKYTFTGEEKDWKGNQASPAGSYGTHFMSSFGNQARPGLQEVNGKMQYFQDPPRNSKENINFSRPEDANYFAENYKDVAPMMRGAAADVTNATEYIKNWYNSPMHGNILRNQIADAGIKSPKRTERIVKRFSKIFNQDLNNSFYNVTPNIVDNPEYYGRSIDDYKGGRKINLNRNFVENNPKLVNSLFAHELAHDNLITSKDKEYVNKNTPEYNPAIDDEIIYNKLTDPAEVRSQIHSIRQLSGENKIYDPLTQPFKKEYLDKVNESYNQGTKDSENYNQLRRLRKYYSDDQITEMMNTISKSNSNDGKVYARNGGLLDSLSKQRFDMGGTIDEGESGDILPSWDKVKATLNPYNWGVDDYTKSGTRNQAFNAARKAGEKEFMWNNQRYNTRKDTDPIPYIGNNPNQEKYDATLRKEYPEFFKTLNRGKNVGSITWEGHSDEQPNRASINTKQTNSNINAGKNPETSHEFIGNMIAESSHLKDPKLGNNIFSAYDWKTRIERKRHDENVYNIPGATEYDDHRLIEPGMAMIAYGNLSPKDIKRIQSFLGVTQDGYFGPQTYKALQNKYKDNPYIKESLLFHQNITNDKDKNPISMGRYNYLAKEYLKQINKDVPLKQHNRFTSILKKNVYSDEALKNSSAEDMDIVTLQEGLSARGYNLSKSTKKNGRFDGIYGDETKAALLNYQSKNAKSKLRNGGWLDNLSNNKFDMGGVLDGLDGVDKGTQVPDATATAKPVVNLNFAITPAQKQLWAKNKRQAEIDMQVDYPEFYTNSNFLDKKAVKPYSVEDYKKGIKEPGLQTSMDPIDLVGSGVYKGVAKALGAKEVAQGVKGLVSDAVKYAEKKSVKPIAPSGSATTTGGIELDEYLTRPINGHMPGTPEWTRLHDIIISNRAAVAAATPKSSKLIHKAKELERNITIPILNSKPALKVRKVILDKINKEAAKSGSLFTPENLEAFKKSGLMHGEEGTLMSKELSSIYNGDVGSGNLRNYLRERFLNNKKLTNEDLKFFSPDRKFSSSIHLPSDVNPVGEFSNFSFSNRNAFSAGKTAVDLDRLISSIPGKWNFNPGSLSGDSYPMWSKIINKKATPQFELSHEGFEYMNTYGRNTNLSKLVKERTSGKLNPVKANEFLIELEKLAGKTVDQWKLPKGALIHPNDKEAIPSLILRKKYKNGGKLNNNKSNWLDNLK